MNDETPFTTIGDEPVEARIVAWVLGEASAFEVAELERLCEERPELMIFKRRMAALHGLITDAEKPRLNDAWKLPEGKRRPLDEIFGEEQLVLVDFEKEKRIRHSGRRMFLTIAACLIFTVIILGFTSPMVMRQSRKADVAEARSKARQREMAAMEEKEMEGQERGEVGYQAMESLRTVLPPELIEGTPKPINLPNHGALGNESAGNSPFGDTSALSSLSDSQPSSPPMPSAASKPSVMVEGVTSSFSIPEPGESFGTLTSSSGSKQLELKKSSEGERAQRDARPRIVPDIAAADAPGPSEQTAKKPTAEASLAFNDHDDSKGLRGSGSGGGFSNAPANEYWTADESVKAELRADKLPAARGMIVDKRETSAGEMGATPADSTPAAVFRSGNEEDFKDHMVDDLRSNPALTKEHAQNVDQVRSNLYKAEGNLNLGKYDDAKREYEDVLRKDPYNTAARRGMEQIASAKSDYYRAAYDHTRAELLAQVDNAWELDVPVDGEKSDKKGFEGFVNYGNPIANAQIDGGIILPKFADSSDTEAGKSKENANANANGAPFWDTSKDAESGKSKSEVAYEIHTGYTSEYNFRGVDLGKDNLAGKREVTIEDAKMLTKAIRDQEDKVEERRKVLSTIALSKGIAYEGKDSFHNQSDLNEKQRAAIAKMKDDARGSSMKRGIGAQEYVEAKREFEKELEHLEQMKLKMTGSSIKAKPEPPKVDLAKLMEEIAASEDPYSTFSLNISDASFQIAQAALAKGERPDPAGIKVEQFYNAVNYGDPAPAVGQPVSCVIEQAGHPVIPGRNLVRVALKTAAAGRSAAQPLRLTLLVDQSGSMSRADRREAMGTAMRSLGTLLTDKDLVTVIGFSRKSRLLAVDMKGNEVGEKLADLVHQSASEGGTNLEDAIKLAEEKAMRQKLVGAQNRIVLFTDGAANLGDADPQRLAAKVEQLRQQGIAFDIAGIAADDLNDELLAELARKGNGRYSVVGKGENENFAKQLAGAFRPAAENVKVQVRFNPERVARYKLIGFEKDRLKTEDFRNDKVDAAELAAEEAGVAIYQVEPLPEGRGEIGEVSVRFRDTASGEMVERMWTMTHSASAPAIDQAVPSMQLAVLSMLAGEKLKGGPLADAIDFKQFVQAQATVKQAFGQDTRVAEMLRMLDALK